jgi:S1-C subfamily serine protease
MKRFYNIALFIIFIFSSVACLDCSSTQHVRGVDISNLDVTKKMITPYLASVELITKSDRIFCSGTIIKNDAGKPMAVLTAYHCIDGQDKGIFIKTIYDAKIRPMHVAKVKSDLDLAIIIGDAAEKTNGPVARFARNEPKVGDEIWTIGNPSGESHCVTKGIIAKKQKNIDEEGEKVRRYYRVTSDIYFGNSGGGAFDGHGRLIGVVSAMEMGYQPVLIVDRFGKINNSGNVFSRFPKPGAGLVISLLDIGILLTSK